MNIWILTSQYPPTVIGGIARYVENAADMFASAGHQVTVVAADVADAISTLQSGARLVRFRPRSHLLGAHESLDMSDSHPAFPHNILSHWPALSYEMAERVTGLARQDGALPDVIECQEYGALPYYLLQRRLVERHPLSDVPLVVHMQSPDFALTRANQEPRYRFPAYWVERMEKFCLLAADGLLASSRFLEREVAHELPQLEHPITVVPLPYPPLPARPAKPTPGDLVYFGRLQVLKGVPRLVEECATLWSRGHEFRLTLMGGDTDYVAEGVRVSHYLRARYGRWIEAGLLVVRQDQPLDQEALWARLSEAWAIIIPSLWENFPNACIEAMGLGKLVIASRSGGQAEMIGGDDRAGILFDWEREGDCAAAIERALAMPRETVEAVGQAARDRISRLTSFDSVLPQRIAHYEQLVRKRGQRATLFPCVTPVNPLPSQLAGTASLMSAVITCNSQQRDTFEQTFMSIVRSSYRPLEVVVTSASAAEAKSWLEHVAPPPDVAVRIIPAADEAAISLGVAASSGEYLALITAGDLVAESFFARAALVLQRYRNVGSVYAWAYLDARSPRCLPTWNSELPYLLARDMLPPVVVLRRSHYLQATAGTSRLQPDVERHSTWIRLAEHGHIGVSLPDILIRSHAVSRTSGGLHERGAITLDLIADRHRASFERYGAELAGLLNANGPATLWEHPALSVPDYRRQYEELRERQELLARRFRFLRPLVSAIRPLLRRSK
jgi:glycogen synthase